MSSVRQGLGSLQRLAKLFPPTHFLPYPAVSPSGPFPFLFFGPSRSRRGYTLRGSLQVDRALAGLCPGDR